MKKIAVIALTIIAGSLVGCGSDPSLEMQVPVFTYQINSWYALQSKYAGANSKVGSDEEIGYKFEQPNKDMDKVLKLKKYFSHESSIEGNIATFKLVMKKKIGECKDGVWTLIYNADNPENPMRTIVTGDKCESLDQNFCSLASSGKCGIEEIEKKDPIKDAITELEIAAKKWIAGEKDAPNTNNFTFKASGGEGGYIWKATSKVKIGECPAKSVWEIGYEGCERWNNIPKKCKDITPKVITSYEGDSGC